MAVKVRQKDGKWWVFIDHHGKRKAKCIGDKRAAEQLKARLDAKIALGEFALDDQQERRLFAPYFRAWLDTYARAHCKDSTVAGYATAFRVYLLPRFGEQDITEISREAIKKLAYEMLAQGKSRSYVKATLAPLSEMFNHAIEDGHLTVNPALRILRHSRTEVGEKTERMTFLTREELKHFLRSCRQHVAQWYPFVLLLARTGLRIGEAVALQWGDLDFHSGFIAVQRNWVDGILTTPKPGKWRKVDMSQQLAATLKVLHIERKKETLRKGWKETPAWVFTSTTGTMMDPDNFRARDWPKLLAKAEMRQCRIHDLRHTYASLLIQQGESLAYVKEQLGHHSIRVTVDTYGHLVPGGNRAAVDRLDDPD
ncbi:MAG: site-specific integrase [Deltaproteobacteria bacterium]|nr:site-specific integrase [Deltaproteobacteria bacterium]